MAATTDHSIDVEWDPPVDNGGGEILGYHVDKVISFTHVDFQLFFSDCLDFFQTNSSLLCDALQAMAGTKDWSRSTERPWKSRAFTVYGVREGAKYLVRVIACNAAGEGTPGFTESVFVRNPAGQLEVSS